MLWKIIGLGGAALMIVSFFVPWWGFAVTPYTFSANLSAEEKASRAADFDKANQIVAGSDSFYAGKFSSGQKVEMRTALGNSNPADDAASKKAKSFSAWLFGWSLGAGIVTFIFGLVVLLLVLAALIVPKFVAILANWDWIPMLIAFGLSLPVFIIGLVFLFGSPGEDSDSILRQGIVVGPWLAFPGGLIAAVGTLVGTILGIIRFVSSLLAKPTKAAAK